MYWRTITRRNLPSGSIKTEEVSYLKEWFNQESIYLVRPTDLSGTLWSLRNQNLFSHSKVLEWLKQQKKYLDKYRILQEFQQNSVKKTDEWMRFLNSCSFIKCSEMNPTANFDNFKDEKISDFKIVSVSQSKNLLDLKLVV